MKDLAYLWRNREKAATASRRAKIWMKRAFHAYGVIALLVRPALFRWRGATVGRLVVLGKLRVSGSPRLLSVGDESAFGRCEFVLHDRIAIGRRVVINDGAVLLTASHSISDTAWGPTRAPISIGDYAWIATNAIILPGVTIGVGAVVGAGAVVREDVVDYGVVSGNPARPHSEPRARDLDYSPAMLCAPLEAWVGHGSAHGRVE